MSEKDKGLETDIRRAYRLLLYSIFGEVYSEADFEIEATQAQIDQLEAVLNTLPVRDDKLIRNRFGIVDGEAKSHEELAVIFSISEEESRETEIEAMKKLRHPSRSLSLRGLLD